MLPNKLMLTEAVLNNNVARTVQGKAVAMGKKERRKKTEKLSPNVKDLLENCSDCKSAKQEGANRIGRVGKIILKNCG